MTRLALTTAIMLLVSGCQLLYENTHHGTQYILHSDHDRDFLHDAGAMIERIQDNFLEVFSLEREEIGSTRFIFKGAASAEKVIDLNYSPSLLGYYIPFFNTINVDTTPHWTRDPDMLARILMHEISHHFLITRLPTANNTCWLNEGLATNLEMCLLDDQRFEYQLLNPPLLLLARRQLLSGKLENPLWSLIDRSWKDFHDHDQKQVNYALSWSLVYFILEEHMPADLPLSARLDNLLELDRATVTALEKAWRRYIISFNLTARLVAMTTAGKPDSLSRSWAIRQLGSSAGIDPEHALKAILRGFSAPEPRLRRESFLAYLDLWHRLRTPFNNQELDARIDHAEKQLAAVLLDTAQPLELRTVILERVSTDIRSTPGRIPILLELLDCSEGQLRALSAHGLASIEAKATILSPSFWINASPSERHREVEEWRRWWESHEESPTVTTPQS